MRGVAGVAMEPELRPGEERDGEGVQAEGEVVDTDGGDGGVWVAEGVLVAYCWGEEEEGAVDCVEGEADDLGGVSFELREGKKSLEMRRTFMERKSTERPVTDLRR